MKLKIVFFSLLALVCISFIAADSKTETGSSRYRAYLGCSITDSAYVDANVFKKLITFPLCAKDSNQQVYRVKSFEITYAERGLYQDDEGKPIIFTDYSGDNFTGDTITKYWIRNFNEHIYKGDTIYFDRVVCVSSDNKSFLCKPMKIVIR